MPIEQRAGHSVYTRKLGTGPRAGLMLHCSLAHGGAWRGLAALLSDAFTFDAPDLLSHGKSEFWDGQGDYHEACTAQARSYLADEPIDLIGHSFGATIALRLAVEAPSQVRSLTLIEPVFFAAGFAEYPELESKHSARTGKMSALLEAGRREEAAKAFLGEWGGGAPWDALPVDVQKDMAARIHVIIDAEPALHKDTMGLLQPGRLEALDMPVLLLRGSVSPSPISEINAGLANRITQAQSRVVEGAGHMLPITHPKPCSKHIRDFLEL